MLMGLTDPIMDEYVIEMNLFAVLGVTRSAGFVSGLKRNAEFTMMLWQM